MAVEIARCFKFQNVQEGGFYYQCLQQLINHIKKSIYNQPGTISL